MTWWQRTSVFYKILGAFIIAMLVFGAFDVYLVIALNQIRNGTLDIQDQYRTLSELSLIDHDNDALSDQVKSYIITHDSTWQVDYQNTSAEIAATFAALEAEPGLTTYEQNTLKDLQDSIQGVQNVESQVFAKVASGDSTGASDLFENTYLAKQRAVADAINVAVINRSNDITNRIAGEDATIVILRSVVLALYILFALIFILLWTALSRGLIRPIEKLRDTAKRIGAGEMDAVIDVRSSDEVGQLATAFREMRAKIREAYTSIQKDQAQLLASINGLPLGFIMLDINGSAIIANRAGQDLFRMQKITISDIVAKLGTNVDMLNIFRHVVANKEDQLISEIFFDKRYFRVLITPMLLPGIHHEVIGAVLLFEDVTQQKRLEQSKGSFVAIASHEMRTPLAIIRGNAELMLEDKSIRADSEFGMQLNSILKSSIRLLSIVNDFLDIQNLEENKISLKIEAVDVIQALKETIADVSQLAKEKNLAISFDALAAPALPILQLDKYRLQQIFMNLITNALHYTERGGVTITIAKEDKYAKVFVADTGIGMEPEDQERLFKKFETGKTFLRSKEFGSGMGLYISRLLARLMGGDVMLVKSEFGSGSTFSLTIPIDGPTISEGRKTAAIPPAGV